MTANVEAMVREAIRAYRAGKKAEARTLLEKAVEADQYNERAWLWLSAVVETPDEQRTCLENVLVINPDNENAKQGLALLRSPDTGETDTAPPKAEENEPFEIDSASSAASSPFEDDVDSKEESIPPPTATSSASSTYVPQDEPTQEEYDDWVTNLNLGSDDESPTTAEQPPGMPDDEEEAFADTDFTDEGFTFEEEADTLTGGPFDMETTIDPPPASSPAVPPETPAKSQMTSPGRETAEDDFLDETEGTEAASSDFGVEGEYGFDESEPVSDDPMEHLQRIPKNIPATRLPGTVEKHPLPVLVGLIVLVLLNLGAAGFLLFRLVS